MTFTEGTPFISVVMPVHNGSRFLDEAIESILNQTCSDFEFIIIDDGSSDSTPEIIARHAERDRRIVSVRREKRGLVKSLNEGLSLARGQFIARHDGDDISLPQRFSTMVGFLKGNPSVSAVGSWYETIDEEGCSTGKVTDPADHSRIAWAMVGYNAIIHPSVVMRRECVAKYGAYDEEYVHAEDYELWTRWIRLGAKLANFPEVLVRYRRSTDQVSHRFASQQSANAIRAATVYVNFLLSDRLAPKQVVGIRQLIGFSRLDSDALCALPLLARLVKLPAFKGALSLSLLRARAVGRFVSATREFGSTDRAAAIAGLLGAVRLCRRLLLKRGWWTCLARQILFYRHPMPSGGQDGVSPRSR